ncbi:hypothetical protein DLD82_15585 [Methanospirillum stamsii]|uniref:Uncharacterized protein n=1 Tax=Methanospirillum stamsii TaxID=1277351 RepID=A0A2V2MQR9_9EURY|nr:hypothetical protein DLD82_15585 [Methanospirillum stamsii]
MNWIKTDTYFHRCTDQSITKGSIIRIFLSLSGFDRNSRDKNPSGRKIILTYLFKRPNIS